MDLRGLSLQSAQSSKRAYTLRVSLKCAVKFMSAFGDFVLLLLNK
jgi:hypothetical protein